MPGSTSGATPSTIPCPTCRRPVAIAAEDRPGAFPFCSDRCRLLDLGAWADGTHVIAGKPVHDLLDEDRG